MQGDNQPFDGPRRRRWQFVSWWFSLLLVVPLVGIIGTYLYRTIAEPSGVKGVIVDAYTAKPVPDATVGAGEIQVASDAAGRFHLSDAAGHLAVTKQGYDPTAIAVTPGAVNVEVRIRPNVVQGTIISSATGQPVKGARVVAKTPAGEERGATTDDNGKYLLVDVPPGATLAVDSPDFSAATADIGQHTQIDLKLRPDVLTGTVTDDKGAPIDGALIAIGTAQTHSGKDGTFRLEGAPETGSVVVKAPGFLASTAALDPSLQVKAALTPIKVKALYVSANTVASPEAFNRILQIADQTEINALVIDIKDSSGLVFYDTKVQLAHDIQAVSPAYDPAKVIQTLHEHHLYAIARQVVFEDPVLAEARPEWAIHDSSNGDLWRTWNGLAWVNAHRSEVWDYNIALAKEAADLGFDEIQLDYIRFPSDGPLNRAEYGTEQNDETRPAAIGSFLSKMYAAISPTKAYLAADVFGLTLWELGDSGIGQHLETVAEHLDYICPMVYPSHFYAGSMGFDIPNDHPYEVILWSLENGDKRIPQYKAKLRPWLQDFDYGPGISYGPDEVRKQIQASDDFGATGWLIWNAANVYHDEALAPAS